MNSASFQNLLEAHFNISDLHNICFQMGIDYENLAGSIKTDKVRELILYCQRNALTDELVAICIELRPNLRELLTAVTKPLPLSERYSKNNPDPALSRKLLMGVTAVTVLGLFVASVFFIIKKISQNPDDMVSESRMTTLAVPNMAFIDSGSFIMGHDEGLADHQPAHTVYLDAYWIDIYEVTNAAYQEFLTETGHAVPILWEDGQYPAGLDDHPVVGVTWHDSVSYCEWNGQKRLPTEAEWEKAARGSEGLLWPWGNDWDAAKVNSAEGKHQNTQPVGSYTEGLSPFGVADMAGNVWEWVNDWYENDYYTLDANRNPEGPPIGTTKVVRGGAWTDAAELTQTFFRLGIYPPTFTHEVVGFRCACDDCLSVPGTG